MRALTHVSPQSALPRWLLAAGVLGVAWNLYGLYQFAAGFTEAGRAAMASQLTPAQAEVYFGLPAWMSGVFGMGVAGGLAGSLLLLMQRKQAHPVLAASLTGYVLLFAGDFYYGVFSAISAQLPILLLVVGIAAGLMAAARHAQRMHLLN